MMLRILAIAFFLAAAAVAQDGVDKVTLKNGDVITGSLKSSAGSALVFDSAALGELKIAFDDIKSLSTATAVEFKTKDDTRIDARITGFDAGTLRLEGGPGTPQTLMLSQIAMINPPSDEDPVWTGSIDAGGHFSDGNTNKRGVKVNATANLRRKDDRFSVKAAWNYSEEKLGTPAGWVLSERNAALGGQYDYFFSTKLFALANAATETDTFADIDVRYTAGLGLGYQWLEEDCLKFSTEVGVNYINREYISAQPREDYYALRLAYKLDWRISDDLQFLQDVNVLPSLENRDKVIAKADTRLRYTLNSVLYTQLQWTVDYENQPSPGFDRLDNKYFWTFGMSF